MEEYKDAYELLKEEKNAAQNALDAANMAYRVNRDEEFVQELQSALNAAQA